LCSLVKLEITAILLINDQWKVLENYLPLIFSKDYSFICHHIALIYKLRSQIQWGPSEDLHAARPRFLLISLLCLTMDYNDGFKTWM